MAFVSSKTANIFERDPTDHAKLLTFTPNIKMKQLIDSGKKYKITVKTDGTNCCIIKENDKIIFCRRQDIKPNTEKFNFVMNKTNGQIIMIGNKVCYKSTIMRNNCKKQKSCAIYFFDLNDDQMPSCELGHMVGFTPFDLELPEDQSIGNFFVDEFINGIPIPTGFTVYATDKISECENHEQIIVRIVKKTLVELFNNA